MWTSLTASFSFREDRDSTHLLQAFAQYTLIIVYSLCPGTNLAKLYVHMNTANDCSDASNPYPLQTMWLTESLYDSPSTQQFIWQVFQGSVQKQGKPSQCVGDDAFLVLIFHAIALNFASTPCNSNAKLALNPVFSMHFPHSRQFACSHAPIRGQQKGQE